MAATVSRDEPDSLSEKLHREMETLGGGFVHRLRSAWSQESAAGAATAKPANGLAGLKHWLLTAQRVHGGADFVPVLDGYCDHVRSASGVRDYVGDHRRFSAALPGRLRM